MKKTKTVSHASEEADGLREEYGFDYAKAKPNRFAAQSEEPRVVVVLDPDVAEVFGTPDSVNEALRALIKIIPKQGRTATKPRRNRTSP